MSTIELVGAIIGTAWLLFYYLTRGDKKDGTTTKE